MTYCNGAFGFKGSPDVRCEVMSRKHWSTGDLPTAN